jgi:hypothetical protein
MKTGDYIIVAERLAQITGIGTHGTIYQGRLIYSIVANGKLQKMSHTCAPEDCRLATPDEVCRLKGVCIMCGHPQYVDKANNEGYGYCVSCIIGVFGQSKDHRLLFAAPDMLKALQLIASGEVMSGKYTTADIVIKYQQIAVKALINATK